MTPAKLTSFFNRPQLLMVVVLLLQFALALSSVTYNTPTMDEQGFLVRGLAYLRNEQRRIRVGHPLGLNALNASLLVYDETVNLPTQDPSWQGTSFHRPGELFLWEIGNDVSHVMFLARLPSVWMGMLLAAVVGRWAGEMSGRRWAGWLALTLVALDPNFLAHSSLTTTDLGLAAAAALAGYTLWRFLRQPGWRRATLAGVAFGLLQNSKFTAGLFVPLFGLVILIWLISQWMRRREAKGYQSFAFPLVQLLIAYPLAGFLTLWACYGFNIGTLPDNLPTLAQLSGLTLPLAQHLEQLLDIGGRLQVNTPSFLLGQYSDQGWWTYFPVAFLLKTPLPTLILLVWAVIVRVRRGIKPGKSGLRPDRIDLVALLIPSLGYFAIALTSNINLGYRHLLPVLPFLFVFIATTLAPYAESRPLAYARPALFFSFPLWLGLSTSLISPHFLAFFNILAGGPENGWRSLVDSNLDWGQDLAGLKGWMDENGVEHLWLSYFGEARPAYYALNYTGLDSFPPRLMNPQTRPFYPADPAPGFYAISASNLQGVLFADHDRFAWFREQEPVDKVGYSIFLYEVPAYGEPVSLALSGVQIDELLPADYALLGTNQVTPLWFEAGQSLLAAPDWLVLAEGVVFDPLLQPLFAAASPTIAAQRAGYTLYQMHWPEITPPDPVRATFAQAEGQITLNEVVFYTEDVRPGDEFMVMTVWAQAARPRPVKLFLHLVAPDGQLISQWDGLGPAWEGWRTGYTLYQLQRLIIPADALAGTYQLWAGLYHPDTLDRWTTPANSEGRVLLGEVTVTNQYLLNVSGQTRPELVAGRWFRQAQPTASRLIEKIPNYE